MLHKFSTATVRFAFKARSEMPPDYRNIVEQDVQTIINLYDTIFRTGKRNEFMEVLGAYCVQKMAEIVNTMPPDVAASLGIAQAAQDARNAAAGMKCAKCGGPHHEAIH